MTEVVRLLTQEGELTPERLSGSESWSMRIPEGVREVIGRRLDRLSDQLQRGARRRFGDWSGVRSRPAREAPRGSTPRIGSLQLLEEALSARVIEEATGAIDRYQFTHALIQETLADELSLTRRVRLHARIAEALEALYGEDADQHAAELAHHFGQAQTLLGPDKFVRYSLVAGEAALAASAHEQALAHFERALAAKDDAEIDDETAALYFGLGRAQLAVAAADTSSSRRRTACVVPSTTTHRLVTWAGRSAVAARPIPLSLGLGDTDFPELIARALKLVAPDSHEAGQLLAQHGWYSGIVEADHSEAQRAFERALSIAQTTGDAALERRTLANAAWVDVWHFRPQECLEKGLKAIELAGQAGDDQTEINARRSIVWALMASGERDQIRAHTAAGFALAERLRDRWSLASAGFDNARLAVYEGDWETARQMSDVGSMARAARSSSARDAGLARVRARQLRRGRDVHRSATGRGREALRPDRSQSTCSWSARSPSRSGSQGATSASPRPPRRPRRLLSLPRLAPALAMVARSARALIAVQRNEAEAAETQYRLHRAA